MMAVFFTGELVSREWEQKEAVFCYWSLHWATSKFAHENKGDVVALETKF